ncbi:MAG: hypothetical protein JEZ03_02630 [Bacteroidales bacterium]|nr:hypothetical protein [Bacteroidales bacterium]
MTSKNTILQHLRREKRLIDYCKEFPTIIEAIGDFGYTIDVLNQGLSYYNETINIAKELQIKCPILFNRVSEIYEKVSIIYYEYRQLRKLAQVALRRHPHLMPALALHERIPNHIPSWIEQAGEFYENILENERIFQLLERFNISHEKIELHYRQLKEIEELEDLNTKEDKERQRCLEEMYSSIEKLNDWTEDLRSVIRVSFDSNPDVITAINTFLN